jgi:adenylosuccinate synthase
MTTTVIVGTQWGDEGKGRVVDVYASDSDMVVRYQGGNNAGHTVKIGDKSYALHLIPSGILREKPSILGNGMVVNLKGLLKEIADLKEKGLDAKPYIFISEDAHIVMPYHIALDIASEKAAGNNKIGTTLKGIGPAYTDKYSRTYGIRVGDLTNKEYFRTRLNAIVKDKNDILTKIYNESSLSADEIFDEYMGYYEEIKDMIVDAGEMVWQAIENKQNVMFEGANATMLDIDHGTYPYVTCSTPTAGGAAVGIGVGPMCIDAIIGVVKAYTTRVGAGPFPTELNDSIGATIREIGHEYGTTTGRPRRCGWLDLCILRKAARVNGLTDMAITHLDVLDIFDEIPVCVGYDIDGEKYDSFPSASWKVEKAKPIYEIMPGWKTATSEARSFEELPVNAQKFLKRIEELVGVDICMVTVGAKRDQTVVIKEKVGK